MARQHWRIRVNGKQRKQLNIELLVAAVMALGEQFGAEQRRREQAAHGNRPAPPAPPTAEAQS